MPKMRKRKMKQKPSLVQRLTNASAHEIDVRGDSRLRPRLLPNNKERVAFPRMGSVGGIIDHLDQVLDRLEEVRLARQRLEEAIDEVEFAIEEVHGEADRLDERMECLLGDLADSTTLDLDVPNGVTRRNYERRITAVRELAENITLTTSWISLGYDQSDDDLTDQVKGIVEDCLIDIEKFQQKDKVKAKKKKRK